MMTPAGCVAAPGATPGYGGYASQVVHQKTGIVLVLISPGAFQMGATGSQEAFSNVFPQHQVNFNYPFYMSKTEVTNGQFRPFHESGYNGVADVDPLYDMYARHLRGLSIMPTGDNYPMVYVSWKNAKAFCQWAGGLDLPSESEWEYACRAGTTTTFYFGDSTSVIGNHAWLTSNSGAEPHQVGLKQPNAWGLYDMCGNVWEWTLDDYIYRYDNAPSDGSARIENKLTKSLRGGGWGDGAIAYAVASYSRYNTAPTNASNDVGFRVVIRVNPSWSSTMSIPYWGKLSGNGQPVNGTASIKFDLFDAVTGGNLVWSGAVGNVSLTNGAFSTSIQPLTPALFGGAGGLWVQITVNGQVMSPRAKLQAVPSAARSFTSTM